MDQKQKLLGYYNYTVILTYIGTLTGFIGIVYAFPEIHHIPLYRTCGVLPCFILFPTTIMRPELMGSTIFDRLLVLVYQNDRPDNLLPSIHCFSSWLCWIGTRRNPQVPMWYQFASLLTAIAICLSTLTVKQHVIVDVFAGIMLAELSYYIAGQCGRIRMFNGNIGSFDR